MTKLIGDAAIFGLQQGIDTDANESFGVAQYSFENSIDVEVEVEKTKLSKPAKRKQS